MAICQCFFVSSYQVLDVIDAYVKNSGGTCEGSEAKPVEEKKTTKKAKEEAK